MSSLRPPPPDIRLMVRHVSKKPLPEIAPWLDGITTPIRRAKP
jgi:hypothetical protein